MRINLLPVVAALCACLLGISSAVQAQICDPTMELFPARAQVNSGAASKISNSNYQMSLTVGHSFIGTTRSPNTQTGSNSMETGFWSFMLKEPNTAVVRASDGDFEDRVEIRWEPLNDPVGPPITEVRIYRDNQFLGLFPAKQTAFLDFNVLPGRSYKYDVITANRFGESIAGTDVGFVNPNGIITGSVLTRSFLPVPEVEIVLAPTISYSVRFNGETDRIVLSDSAINHLAEGTLEFWVRPEKLTQATIFSKRRVIEEEERPLDLYSVVSLGTFPGENGTPVDGVPGRVYFSARSGVPAASTTRSLPQNAWTHVAIAFSESSVRFYINGLLDNVVSGDFSIPDDHSPRDPRPVRTYAGYWEGVGNYFQGNLDELRFWRTVRTDEQIFSNLNRTIASDDENLFMYWKFDEGKGTRAYDLSGNFNHGLFCTPMVHTNKMTAPVYTSGITGENGNYIIKGVNYGMGTTFSATPRKRTVIGRALEMDGVNDVVEIPDAVGDTTMRTGGTIEAWVYPRSVSGVQPIVALRNNGADSTGGVLAINDGRLEFRATENMIAFDTTPIDTGYWYHVAVLYSDSVTAFYVNGERGEVVSGDYTIERGNEATTTTIGSDGSAHFYGRIDEVRLWRTARTQQNIQAHMNAPFTTDQDGMEAYWKLNEGTGELAADETSNLYIGNVLNADSTIWTKQIAMNEIFNHEFQPLSRDVTLAPGNSVVDRIDYTDISILPVVGFVQYLGTYCFAESVEVLVDGVPVRPAVYTEKDGKFTVYFEPGTTHQLSFRKGTHTFAPAFYEIRNISQPLFIERPFFDTQTRTVSGSVVGGLCAAPIGISDVTLFSVDGCFKQTVQSDPAGNYAFYGVPPIRYNVFVKHPDPTIAFDGEQVDLVNDNDTVRFVYRSPLLARIEDLPQNECNINVLEKGLKKVVKYRVFELYSDGAGATTECLIPNGQVVVVDKIGNIERRDTLTIANGIAKDTIKGGTPNILAGGAHPYQKQLQIVAIDDKHRQASDEAWIYVLGQKPRGSTFATKTPELPFWTIHDPPGDASYSYLSAGQSVSTSMSFSMERSNSNGVSVAVHLGPDVTTSFGLGAETEFEVDATIDFTATSTVTVTQTSSKEQTWTFNTSETFTTADSPIGIGDDGDIYIGGAMNMLYGITDILAMDSTCALHVTQDLLLIPETFATTFIYSEYHIRTNVIPNLYLVGDTISAERWQSILNRNAAIKASAPFIRNISFDAGATYENSETTERSATSAIESSLLISDEIATTLGLTVNGIGEEIGFNVTTEYSFGKSSSSTASNSNTFGFVLHDDDQADHFSVNVRKDPVYGTPVFQLVSGTSSCPHEPNTLAREGAVLSISPVTQVNVPPDEDAVFSLILGNASPTNENRDYFVFIDYTSNPNGAYLSINGADLGAGIPFTIPGGMQVPVTLTVTRGPDEYEYNDLRVYLVSACEMANSTAGTPVSAEFSDTVSFSVHFEVPCSEVQMAAPTNNWLVTSEDEDSVYVTLFGYDRDNPDFEELRFQYRVVPEALAQAGTRGLVLDSSLFQPLGTPFPPADAGALKNKKGVRTVSTNPWINAVVIPKDSLPENQNYLTFVWKITPDIVADSRYEIRAISTCFAQRINGSTAIIQGNIDRNPPALLGSTEPVDGVLGPNDQIIARFDENIDCSALHPLLNVHLVNSATGLEIDKTITCNGNTVVVTPNVANQFLENQVLRLSFTDDGLAPAYGVRDVYGNRITRSLDYEFYVDRNSMRWNTPTFQGTFAEGEQISFVRRISNEGTFSQNFSMMELPPWLTVTPSSATIPAGFSQDVTFTVSTQLTGGTYKDTVYAKTANGDEDFLLDFRVLCPAPQWSVIPSNFLYNMNIVARLLIDSLESQDEYTQVGVFVGNEARGVANVRYVPAIDEYLVFLTVYSNVVNGEQLSLRVWDAGTCRELGRVHEQYTFAANAVYGTIAQPSTLTATTEVIGQIPLSKGWNWFSLNLRAPDLSVNKILDKVSVANGNIIKGQAKFSQAVPGFGWVGTLAALDNRSMYQIKLDAPDTVETIGYVVSGDTISIAQGWNWISFQPLAGMNLNAALASYPAVNGDLIKSQSAFAVFYAPYGWLGDLTFMSPRLGYLLKAGVSGQLVYPEASDGPAGAKGEALPLAHERLTKSGNVHGWAVDPALYEYTMALIGEIHGRDVDTSDVVAAFAGTECRGVAQVRFIEPLNKHFFFLQIYSNTVEGEEVTFKVSDADEKRVFLGKEPVVFAQDALVGTIEAPFAVTASLTAVASGKELPKEFSLSQNYPNPFNPATTITYAVPHEARVEIAIYDVVGQKVRTLMAGTQNAGEWSVVWDGADDHGVALGSGVYFCKMSAGDFAQMRKLILMK